MLLSLLQCIAARHDGRRFTAKVLGMYAGKR
jgi:hypothetical protein